MAEERRLPVNFQTVVLPCWGLVVGSGICIYVGEYRWALICAGMTVISILYRFFVLSVQPPKILRYVAMVIFAVCLFGIMFAAHKIANYFNQQAVMQQHCGTVQNIQKAHSERQRDIFYLVSAQKEERFLYPKQPDQQQVYLNSKLCIDYSLDKNWARYPYIHQIKAHD